MKIPLPSGNFIYIGKQNQEIQLTKKSADLIRDDQGNVNGTVPSYSLENVEKYVNIVFSPNSYIRNFVFLFENIAEIQFPINYLTSRIKNGNFVVKRWDDDTVVWSDSAISPKKSAVGGLQTSSVGRVAGIFIFLFLNVFNQKPPRPSGTPSREGNLLLTKYLDILLVLNFICNISIISLSYLRKNKIMSEFPSSGGVPKAGWYYSLVIALRTSHFELLLSPVPCL